jgi:hypothetical protein
MKNNHPKKLMGISLFEEQLIRNYLSGDHGKFFQTLDANHKIIIFTSSFLQPLIQSLLIKYKLQRISVVIFNPPKKTSIVFFLEFLMRWSTSSNTILMKIRRSESKRAMLSRHFVLFIDKFMNHILIDLYRKLYRLCHTRSSLNKGLEGPIPILDLLFVTSLTNSHWDIPLCLLYFKAQTYTIGTVRSWDNLTSHGSIVFIPDKFLSHSEWLSEVALRIQRFPASKLHCWGSPSHLAGYKASTKEVVSEQLSTSSRRILYASMGLHLNPDEQIFLKWLTDIWKSLPGDITLTILEHPKFTTNSLVEQTERVEVKRFKYATTSLHEYYDFLSEQNLIFGGGTTVLLDAAFAEIPIIALQFEIGKHAYWKSSLRQFDTVEHTSEFFKRSRVTCAQSKEELISFILSPTYDAFKVRNYQFFSGYDTLCLPDME